MKQLSLAESYASFESFFESETVKYIIWGIHIASLIIFFLFLYLKYFYFKNISVEDKNKLTENRRFRFFFSLGVFTLFISLIIILRAVLYNILDYVEDTFGIVILNISAAVFLVATLAYYLIIKKKGFIK